MFATMHDSGATPVTLEPVAGGWRGRFAAMASPCEVLIDGADAAWARELADIACAEARRIEHKFSRYRSDSEVARIHAAHGAAVSVDDETALLLDFAAHCHAASEGLFDITSGVLRAAWRFDGSATLPSAERVAQLRDRVGWSRVRWQRPTLVLPAGMEIDFGGLGKEYAVDRALALVRERSGTTPVLVNFGGDLAVSGPRAGGRAWQVGIEHPSLHGEAAHAAACLELHGGALATSGDARRCLVHDGVRYGHILDPRSGWPVRGAPRSVTVAAATCSEAGVTATLAMLQGERAEAWLAEQGATHWVLR